MRCRLLIDDAAGSGSWNMAVDETLLESARSGTEATLRWYRWHEATVSLGYFQKSRAHDRDRFGTLPLVRRLSGGGAILHHHELTYSCTIGPQHPLAEDPTQLYVQVHQAIISVLSDFGVPAAMRGEKIDDVEHLFLCFGRGDPRDVVIDGHKILGSAQRRRRGAILQHGSLLLRQSEHAEEFPGICELSGIDVSEDELLAALATRVSQALAASVELGALTDRERQLAEKLEEQKYRLLDWSAPRPALAHDVATR
ncbi:MAG: biotin/lipoate A/B protein ligase family protein [Maioricimonas sp. JB049]